MSNSRAEYIIEFYKLGNSVKVSAIDPVTLKEAVVIGSPKLSKKTLSDLAIRKLRYLLAKEGS